MNTIDDFKNNAISRGLCSVYADKWDNAQNIEQLLRLGLDINGCSYFIESIIDGFGVSKETIYKLGFPYINGKYIFDFKNSKGNGYDTELYVLCNDKIDLRTSNLVIIDCESIITIKPYCVSNIFISESDYSKISLEKEKTSLVTPKVTIHIYKGKGVWGQVSI